MLKIWGRVNSINVQKVIWAVHELDLPYERLDAGGAFGITTTPEYLRMNPNQTVPTIDDDGFVLWESNAIVRYLASRHGAGRLWPGDLRTRADADRWMDWQTSEFTNYMRDAFWQLIRTPEAERNVERLNASLAHTEKRALVLESCLAGRAFLTGKHFTVADIAVGAAAHRWLKMPIERPATPNILAWMERIYERPAALAVLPKELN